MTRKKARTKPAPARNVMRAARMHLIDVVGPGKFSDLVNKYKGLIERSAYVSSLPVERIAEKIISYQSNNIGGRAVAMAIMIEILEPSLTEKDKGNRGAVCNIKL
jgi:hypothetical protein